jgi:LysM repeat protein
VLLILLLLLAGAAAMLAASAGDAATPARTASVVVREGDTLWSLAARYLPTQSPFAAIEEIRRLNGLDGYTIRAGQTLLVPGRR